MKKALKTQLSAAVAMMLVAAIALTGATYAWFTAIANPDVQSIDLYVKAADTLMLSTLDHPEFNNVGDWRVSVSNSDITDAQPAAFPNDMLNVSSLFNVTSNGFYTASHASQGAINGYATIADATNNYAKFSLWVKSTRNGFVYLKSTSQVTPAADVVDPKTGIAYTVRVGFVPVDKTGETPVEDWANAVVWEPNSTNHVAVANGGPGGTSKLTTNAVNAEVAVPGSEEDLAAAIADTQTTYDFKTGDTNVTGNASQIGLFNAQMDTPKQFNVYIWVEGADQDTVNAVAKSTFSTYLMFGQSYDSTLS